MPLSDRQRRRSSTVERVSLDASESLPFLRSTEVGKASADPSPSSASTEVLPASAPRAVQRRKATGAWDMDAGDAGIADGSQNAGLAAPLDLRLWLGLSLSLCLAALLSPASGQPGARALWTAIYAPAQVSWAAGLRWSVWALIAAMTGGVLLWARGALRVSGHGEDSEVARSVLGTGVLAIAALVLRRGADPDLFVSAMAPMRGQILGLSDVVWAALIAGGLLHLLSSSRQRVARVFVAVGAAALLVEYWTPVGWIGQTELPVFAALKAFGNDPAQLAQGMVRGPIMASPGLVLLGAVVPVAVLALLASPRSLPVALLRIVAGLVLLLPALPPLVAADGMFSARLGASVQLLAVGALLSVFVMGVLLNVGHVLHRDLREGLELIGVLGLLSVFVILKANAMRFSATDEGIYFYAARAWSDGVWPYHDFFFSHPPLHILPLAILFALFGYSFFLAKSLSVVAVMVAAVALWRTVRKHIDPMAGVFALGLYLLAGEVLKASTNLTGVNLTAMWMVLGLWATMNRKDFFAGLLFGAAACTGVYAVGAFLAVAVLMLFAPRPAISQSARLSSRIVGRPFVQISLGFFIVVGTINGLGWLMAGEDYVGSVYRYHFLKASKVAGFTALSEGPTALFSNIITLLKGRDFTVSLYYQAMRYWLALLAPLGVAAGVALRRWERRRAKESMGPRIGRAYRAPTKAPTGLLDNKRWLLLVHPRMWWIHLSSGGFVMIMWVVALALLAEFAQFKERYDFYYALILPVVAMVAAGWIYALLRVLWAATGSGWSRPKEGAQSDGRHLSTPPWVMALAALGLALSLVWVPLNMWANHKAYPSEYQVKASSKGPGQRLNFEWIDPPGAALFGGLSRHLFWQPYRLRGSIETGIHHFLWSKKRWFSTASEIATYIRVHSERSDTITGASTYAPLIALLADRRMAADHVDTNSKTFKTGVVSREVFWRRVCKDNVKFIVAGPRSFFSPRRMPRKRTVATYFKRVQIYQDPKLKHWRSVRLELWERRRNLGKGDDCKYLPPRGRQGR